MTMLQIIGGPPAANASANVEYTPTTGERYVKPSAKFSHNPMRRSKRLSYPSSASCSASDGIPRTSCCSLGARNLQRVPLGVALLVELVLVALSRPRLGAEPMLEADAGRWAARLRIAGASALLGAAGLHARRLVLHLGEVRRPRRVAEPALLVAAREVEQPVQRPGLEVHVRRRVADRAQPLGDRVDAQVARLGVGDLVPAQA